MNYAIYTGAHKSGLSDTPDLAQAFTKSEAQAKHMASFWGASGWYEKINPEHEEQITEESK